MKNKKIVVSGSKEAKQIVFWKTACIEMWKISYLKLRSLL